MRIKALVFSVMLLGMLCFALPCFAAGNFYVYCADGKVVIDTRDLIDFKSQTRAKDVDTKGAKLTQNEAELLARGLGGVGAKCKR